MQRRPKTRTRLASVRNHGDPSNRSVCVVIPSVCRTITDIDDDTTLQLHATERGDLIIIPDGNGIDKKTETEISRLRKPVKQHQSLTVNIPIAIKMFLKINRGDQMKIKIHEECIVYRQFSQKQKNT